MEMENSMNSHMINVQTQILQEIRDLKQRELNNSLLSMSTDPAGAMGTNIEAITPSTSESPGNMASDIPMYNPDDYYAPMAPQVPPMTSVTNQQINPQSNVNITNVSPAPGTLNYGSVSQAPNARMITPTGMIASTIDEVRNFDPSRHSKESAAEYMAQQTRGFQEGAVGAVSSLATGAATVGSFLLPGGFLTSMAVGGAVTAGVGYAGNAMVQGARDSLNYQDILRRDGYKAFNAFESTTEFGGIGINLEDRQGLADFMRDLAPEKFLDDADLSTILQGSLDNKLLKSVSDVDSFKEKFSSIVDAVKQITITMDQTLDEAIAFMGEMERRGIKTQNMSAVAAQTKVTSSVLGMDATQYANQLLGSTDSIIGGTTMNAQTVMNSINQNAGLGGLIEDDLKTNDPALYNLMKNSGGAATVAANLEASTRSFNDSELGRNFLYSWYGSGFTLNAEGEFEVNADKMNDLMSGKYSPEELLAESTNYVSSLSPDQQAKLLGSSASLWNEYAGTRENFQFITNVRGMYESQGMDPETAMVSMGFANDYETARLYNSYIEEGSDPENLNRLSSRSFKEAIDSAAIANNPSIFSQASFWFKRNVTNEIGDVGQGVTDFIGTKSQDYQQLLTGMEDRSVVGADLPQYSEETIDAVFGREATDVVNKNIEEHYEDLEAGEYNRGTDRLSGNLTEDLDSMFGQADVDLGYDSAERTKMSTDEAKPITKTRSFTKGMMDNWVDRLDEGTLTGAEIRSLKDQIENDELANEDKERAQYVINKASGEYDGWGNLAQAGRNIQFGAQGTNEWINDNASWLTLPGQYEFNRATLSGEVSSKEALTAPEGPDNGDLTLKALEDQEEDLAGKFAENRKKLTKIISSDKFKNFDDVELRTLEMNVAAGRVEEVEAATDNEELIKLTKSFAKTGKKVVDLGGSMDTLTEQTQFTEGMANLGSDVYNLLSASGIYSDVEMESYFGEYKDEGKRLKDDLKEGMSSSEMEARSREMYNKGADLLAYMPDQEKMYKLAEYIANQNEGDDWTMEKFYMEGSDYIDSDKLYQALADISRQTQAGKDDKDAKGEGGDVAKSAKNHEEAIAIMIDTFKTEAAMLRKAASDVQNGVYNSPTTSVTSGS